jgi:biotin operon repressor
MQFQQMRHVVALVERRSLASAAKALGISQPALSKSLRRLETDLGVKLFERTARGVLATEFGRELARHARAIVVEVAAPVPGAGFSIRCSGVGPSIMARRKPSNSSATAWARSAGEVNGNLPRRSSTISPRAAAISPAVGYSHLCSGYRIAGR